MFSYIAFDTETTGTSAQSDAIIEIGAVRFVKGAPVQTFQSFVDPGRSIPPDATRVNGITNSMVKGQPRIDEVLEQFTDFCGDDYLVAHNAPFDLSFITAAGISTQTPLPQGLVFDTLGIAKQVLPELFNHKQETLVRHFNLPQNGFHRAADDAVGCGHLFVALLKQIKKNGGTLKFDNIVNLSGGERKFPFIEPRAKQMGMFF